jgi:chromosome partitioning protein
MKIIAIAGQKGGISKTTTTMHLAACTAASARTLAVDADPQQSATWWAERAGENLPFDFTPELHPERLARLRELPYDVVFIDTPGSLQDTAVLRAVIDVADLVIMPTDTDPLSWAPLVHTIRTFVEPTGTPYRILINKYDPRDRTAADDTRALIDGAGLPRFVNVIRTYKTHSSAPLRGDVVTQYPRTQKTRNAIDDYHHVALELFATWTDARAGA